MNHASLFTGIGGFDLAAEWMGWQNIFQVEINPWCQKLLKQNFPHAAKYTDVRQFDGTRYTGQIDVLTGGFPCQPYSTAGKRKGKEDERHLWPEMLRIIREISPRWVVGENVRGLTNWNGGLVFDEVQSDLEAIGYEVTPFLLPAASVNAPHRRDRIWFVAYASSDGHWGNNRVGETRCAAAKGEELKEKRERLRASVGGVGATEFITNTNREQRCERRVYKIRSETAERYTCQRYACSSGNFQNFPTQPGICRRNDGVSNRVDRIKGLGNAVVPQVVLQIFKAIEQYEQFKPRTGR